MRPPPLPPDLPSLTGLIDDLDDIDPNGHESAKHLIARLVDGYSRQNRAIIAQNSVLREIAEQFHEAWKFAREANIRSANNERRTTQLKVDVQRAGTHVEQTGTHDLQDLQDKLLDAQIREEFKRNRSGRIKMIFSIKEKLIFVGIMVLATLIGAGCTVVIYEVSHRGPSVPSLPAP